MERLTARLDDGRAYLNTHSEKTNIYQHEENNPIEKLADYEDAEEQGRLLIMPCEIDSYLYAIIYDVYFHTYNVSEYPIVDFCFSGAIITDACIGDPNCEIWTPEDQEEYHVCFSKEEAEKKAVELMQAEAKLKKWRKNDVD